MSSRFAHAFFCLATAILLGALSSPVLAQQPPKHQAPAMNQAPSSSPAPSANPLGDAKDSIENRGLFSGLMDPFDYDPRGRRDPFVEPVPDRPAAQESVHGPLLPLQKFDLGQLRLVGIIWDVKHPKAMIKDPSGQTHVVGTNTKVGPHNGYIAVIREGEMVVVETTEQDGKLVSSAQVVKIAR